MPRTDARLLANRANALRSTGPRTDEGKETSRRNALKHGLTGAGVVVPGEDADEVARRSDILGAELAPEGGMMARILTGRIAALSVRSERSTRHETAATATRARHAAADFDEARRLEVDHLLSQLPAQPASSHRRLLTSPEGIDLLLGALGALRGAASPGPVLRWTVALGVRLDHCTGHDPAVGLESRVGALTRVVLGDGSGLNPVELTGREPANQTHWALGELARLIDAEIERLTTHRATLDSDAVVLDRAEAGERVLFDSSPAAELVRKYEAQTDRTILRMLRELRTVRLEAEVAAPPSAATGEEMAAADAEQLRRTDFTAPMGSFFPGAGFTPSTVVRGQVPTDGSSIEHLGTAIRWPHPAPDRLFSPGWDG